MLNFAICTEFTREKGGFRLALLPLERDKMCICCVFDEENLHMS